MIKRRWTFREGKDVDPSLKALFLFGEEFLALRPNREIKVFVDGAVEPTTRIPIEEIICDQCNELVATHEPCVLSLERLYCWRCAERWIVPYLDAVVLAHG